MPIVRALAVVLPGLLAAAGILFCGLCMLGATRFKRAQKRRSEDVAYPPISILKPIRGLEPELASALRSHCLQNYPARVELLCGLQSMEDSAVPVIRALMAEFPTMRIEIVHTPLVLGANGKVSNLAQLLPHARHRHLLISDADIVVTPYHLQQIAAPFEDEEVGAVTTVYTGRTHPERRPTLGSRLEALGIASDFVPGVLASLLTDKEVRFALGAAILVSRQALAAAGGFEALTNVLADDHELGARVAAAGFRVVLTRGPASTAVPGYTLRGFWQHQLRWARTVRNARPWGHAGLVFTHPVPWALLFVVASAGSQLSLAVLWAALLARMAVALRVGYFLLHDWQVMRDLIWLPLRDCFGLAIWAWSYAGNSVIWRGERFRVKKGRLFRTGKSQSDPRQRVAGPGIQ